MKIKTGIGIDVHRLEEGLEPVSYTHLNISYERDIRFFTGVAGK